VVAGFAVMLGGIRKQPETFPPVGIWKLVEHHKKCLELQGGRVLK
jgi:hypothetical protein